MIWLVVKGAIRLCVCAQQRVRHKVLVANDAAAKKLPSCEARPGRRLNNSAAGKAAGGKLREDCVEGGLAGAERGVCGV